MEKFRVGKEIALGVLCCMAICLACEGVFAVVINLACPSGITVKIVNGIIQEAGVFFGSVLAVKKGRALFKGMAVGGAGCLCTALLFGAIGGGFYFTPFLWVEWALSPLFGGLGAIVCAKVKKEL